MQVQTSALSRVPLGLLLVLTLLATFVPALVWPSPAAADTAAVTGTVYDWDTLDPLSNISIRVQDYATFDQTISTDVNGEWSMPGVPVGEWVDVTAFDLDGGVYGFSVRMVSVSMGGEYVEHYLQPGSMLSGTVTDSSATPVPDVEVTTWSGPDPVTTDVNGEFAFPYPFPSGPRFLNFEPPADSGLLGTDQEYEVVGGTPTVADAVLFAPGSMSGTVTAAADGTAIGDIDVTVTDPSLDCWDCEHYTSTADDGTWSISDLPPGDYIVHFEDWWHDEFATEYYNGVVRESEATPVPVAEGEEVIEIDATLDVATSIRGTVMAHGFPVNDAELRLYEGGTAPENVVAWSGTCCGDNSFDFSGLRPGTYHLQVDLQGVVQHWHGPTGQVAEAVAVTPTSEAPVEGLVVELQDVAVIDANVQYDGQPLVDLGLEYQDDGVAYFVSSSTDSTGSATFVVPPGPGALTSYGLFHATEPFDVSPAAGEVVPASITATSSHLGTVGNPSGVTVDPSTDTEGVPTVDSGAAFAVTFNACAEAWSPSLYLDPIAGEDWFESALVETSPGTYEASLPEGVTPGLYRGSAWMDCVGGTEIEFGLYSPSQLQVVDRNGTPLPGVDATLTDMWGDEPLGAPNARLAPITPAITQTTDADGMFGWLLDTDHYYGLVLSDGSCTSTVDWLWGNDLTQNTFELDCGPLPQDAPGIWGVVQDATTGDPLSGIDVELWAWSDTTFEDELVATVTTAADGVYAFGDEHVDTFASYDLYAIDPAEQFGLASDWTFVDGDPMVVRSDLHMADEVTIVSGTVTSKAGPVEGATINGPGPTLVTNASGEYRSVALSRDHFYHFNVWPPDGSELYTSSLDVETTDPAMTVDVYLKSPGVVSGAVTDGDSKPLGGIIVSSASFGQILTEADGTYEATGVFPGEDVIVQFYDETGTYAYEWWNDKTSEETANPITVVEGETTADISAVLGPGASIVGTITAVGGTPIPDEPVFLYDDAGNFVSDTQTDDSGHYAFPGLQVGSYVIGYVGVGGPWYPGDTDEVSLATRTEVTTTGAEVIQNLQVPGVGFVGGVVRQNGDPVVGAWVSADSGTWWDSVVSSDGGTYLVVAAVGTADVTAWADQWSEAVTETGLSVDEGGVTVQDFDLTSQLPGSTQPPPDGTTVTGARTTSGLPTLGPSDPIEVSTTGCVGGTASFDVVEVYPGSGTVADDVPMTEDPDGTYVGNAPSQVPGRVYEVRIFIDCPGDTSDESTDFGLYIDPAGTIVDTEGTPIEGATATLYRSDNEGGPYTVVPDGSTIMSPENRTNPDVVGADGVFQWLTLEGWYKVRAEKDGCTDPASDATFVETDELPVPPEHVGLILVLDCGEGATAPTTSITSGPSGTVATTTATFGFTSATGGATFDCRLDGGAWEPCTSPIQYSSLPQGAHTFAVRASAGGLTDATPATRSWTVDTVAPNTSITSGPSGTTTSQSASFGFTGTEAGSTFQCRLDGGSWGSCTSPKAYSSLTEGSHTFQVRARDAVGNTDGSPASRSWTVDLPDAPDPSPDPSDPAPDPAGPTPEFTDDDESVFQTDIEKLAASGITKGCNPPANDRFCPDAEVTRGAMAAFLVRGMEYPAAPLGRFRDARGHLFEADIAALAGAGVTKGCNPPTNDRFCPDEFVTRGEMAAFLTRALELPPAPVGRFRDARGHLFEADIAALAAAGITKGCNPPTNDRFCPDDYVERGEMAAFLVRGGLTD